MTNERTPSANPFAEAIEKATAAASAFEEEVEDEPEPEELAKHGDIRKALGDLAGQIKAIRADLELIKSQPVQEHLLHMAKAIK